LQERHPESPKLLPAKVRFFKHWLSLTEEQRAKEFGDERLYQVSLQELKSIGLPAKVEDVEKLVSDALPKAKTSIENANEYIKLRMKVVANAAENGAKFQEIAVAALENDTNKGEKVKKAENLLRRIVKSGSDGAAFKAMAKAQYKYATTFA
jgi:FKBP-type peptidyl-prolyl cis-trans isomerase